MRIASRRAWLVPTLVLGGFLPCANAHVALDGPNGGESFTSGQPVAIGYNPEIAHSDTIRYQLAYSLTGEEGPWISIDDFIPVDPDRNFDGAPNTYLWTAPNLNTDSARIRVFQDNPDANDYFDVSDAPFSIALALPGDYSGDGTVDAADYTVWRDALGSTELLAANGDNTGASRGVIDSADYTLWKTRFGAAATSRDNSAVGGAANGAVPEPSAALLALLGAGIALTAHRGPRR